MKFAEWKLLREEQDIGQSVNNALMYVDNPNMFSRIISSCMQIAKSTGNQAVGSLLNNLAGLPGAISDARRQGRGENDINGMLDNARNTVRQIQAKLSPEAAAFHSGRQGVDMMGHENTPVNTAAHQRGSQQYQADLQARQQRSYA